jgi:murein DD-endopeptidase MepM/ murein hydrolase activator NlpD
MNTRFPVPESYANTPNAVVLMVKRHGKVRQVQVPAPLVVAGGLLLGLLMAWYLVASLYFVFRDDMLARLLNQQADMQYAYEDRLAAQRLEMDRLTSRQLIDTDTLAGKVHELLARQAQLENRQSVVNQLAEQPIFAGGRRVDTRQADARPREGALPAIFRAGGPRPGAATGGPASAYAPAQGGPALAPPRSVGSNKPVPEADALELRLPGSQGAPERTSALSHDLVLADHVQAAREAAERLERLQLATLDQLEATARTRGQRWQAALAELGLDTARFQLGKAGGQGGPHIPLPAMNPFERRVAQLQAALGQIDRQRRVVEALPLARPLPADIETSSGFGPRLDPFTRSPAMHSGLDFRAPYGTAARATGPGKVVEAGWVGGYGNMVEVDHGHGLTTRYAHLTSIDVEVGDAVTTGMIVGRVGSTGRSTGPHLHYETRIDGEATDPMRFLRAGRKLDQAS